MRLREFCSLLELNDGEGNYIEQRFDLHVELSELMAGVVDNSQIDTLISLALQRLQHLDAKLMAAMQQAAIGLTKAMQYSIDRYPAIVLDSKAVVFGMTDLASALAYYRRWLSRSQQ